MMRGAWAVCKREFASFFVTPVGYIVIAVYALIAGMGFSISFLRYAEISENPAAWAYPAVPDFEEVLLSPFLVFCGVLIMFMGPLVTMRLLAEERSRGTMELLLTHPLRDRDIIFGKYLAALGMLLVMMSVVGVHLCIVAYYADVEPAVLVFGLLAVFLMGAAFFSMGLFVSAISSNLITAAIIAFGAGFVSYILGSVGENMPKQNPTPETWPEPLRDFIGAAYELVRSLIQQLPLDVHAKDMAQGIVAAKDVVYYVLVVSFFLFLTFRALESRKWRA